MKLYLRYFVGSVALVSLASQAFSVKFPESFDAEPPTPRNSPLVEASLDLSPKPSSRRASLPLDRPFSPLFPLLSPLSPPLSSKKALSYSLPISPDNHSGGRVFIFEPLSQTSSGEKISVVSLEKQEPLSTEEVSDILANSDLSYVDLAPSN